MVNKMSHLLLIVLFAIYLLFNFDMPEPLANMIDSVAGKLVVILMALILFSCGNPILSVLGLLVAYKLISSASSKTGMSALDEYAPTEKKKWSQFSPARQFPYTLEQEVVKNMTTQKFNPSYVKAPFRPVLDDTHDASPLNA
jgi:hypothetical protein